MQQIRNTAEALLLMKDGYIITEKGKDFYIYRDMKIHRYHDGTHFSLSEEDFLKLYEKNSFYCYQEAVAVDEEKDEAYYRYYRK